VASPLWFERLWSQWQYYNSTKASYANDWIDAICWTGHAWGKTHCGVAVLRHSFRASLRRSFWCRKKPETPWAQGAPTSIRGSICTHQSLNMNSSLEASSSGSRSSAMALWVNVPQRESLKVTRDDIHLPYSPIRSKSLDIHLLYWVPPYVGLCMGD
jgi:hypothetical protein